MCRIPPARQTGARYHVLDDPLGRTDDPPTADGVAAPAAATAAAAASTAAAAAVLGRLYAVAPGLAGVPLRARIVDAGRGTQVVP
jgi:hypothetical protein